MKIKGGADAGPKINRKHDRQIGPLKTRAERDNAEQLKTDKHDEKEQIQFFVLKHEVETEKQVAFWQREDGEEKFVSKARSRNPYFLE